MLKIKASPKSRFSSLEDIVAKVKAQTGDTQEVMAEKVGLKAQSFRAAIRTEKKTGKPPTRIMIALKSAYPDLFEEKTIKGKLEDVIRDLSERMMTLEAQNTAYEVIIAELLADRRSPSKGDRKLFIAEERLAIQKVVTASVGRQFSGV